MSQPIFTNKAEIETALTQVKSVVSGMETNLQTLKGLKDMLLTQFKGDGADSYEGVAMQLESRLNAYQSSINSLDQATNHAATLIGDADKQVAGMFRNLL
ncbi:WXG100 family type VII secretion target [Nocardia zapadnayensis]|uniref:WXG100 family type VII secretion target n=1 Tax=Nocardia rhamnosiphila TaxID=426716 RepID=UPI002245B7FE|nr:WXG100 family type VII secretion target [Nocardia zapadnayensis]MCX0273816.1 WXG100 family type VII secretion target [Nocardia zapadnayensis]